MIAAFDYASPSVFESDRERALLGVSANARRPVRFHGRVTRNLPLFRFTLRALSCDQRIPDAERHRRPQEWMDGGRGAAVAFYCGLGARGVGDLAQEGRTASGVEPSESCS